MNKRTWLIAIGVVILIAAAAIPAISKLQLGKPVAAPALSARYAASLPTDPWDAAWNKTAAVKLPLSAVSTPGAKPGEVSVRALSNGQQVAFRMEWKDDSQEVTTLRPQDFADQAAIQLADGTIGICMGQADRYAHIWQWKADWQYGSREMKTQYPNMHSDSYTIGDKELFTEDLYSRPAAYVGNLRAQPKHESPVENLVAGGFSSLTTAPEPFQKVQGSGVWKDGKWAVVFTRGLAAAEGDLSLDPTKPAQVAFAVWDGKLMQRNGMKYTTSWASLSIEGAKAAAAK